LANWRFAALFFELVFELSGLIPVGLCGALLVASFSTGSRGWSAGVCAN
jgi:hypothetical protein